MQQSQSGQNHDVFELQGRTRKEFLIIQTLALASISFKVREARAKREKNGDKDELKVTSDSNGGSPIYLISCL